MSRMPIRNVGRLTPTSESAWNSLAIDECGRRAEYTPMRIPKTRASSVATAASSRVAGMRSLSSCATGWRNWYDMPNSNFAALVT
jgi:hypothetical protein